jgi:AraC-like DNA-binding protein
VYAKEPAFQKIDTTEIPEQDRRGYVRESLGRQLMGIDIEPDAGVPLRVVVKTLPLAALRIAAGHSSSLAAERTRSLLADGQEDFIFDVFTGHARLSVDGRFDIDVPAGHGVLYPLDRRFTLVHGNVGVRTVRLSRGSLGSMISGLGKTPVQVVPNSSHPLHLLFSFSDLLLSGPAPSAELAEVLTRQLRELSLLTLTAGRRSVDQPALSAISGARLGLMKRDIEQHLTDPTLDANWLAPRHGITPRYVQMLFERDGTTASGFIRLRRLMLAYSQLRDPAFARHRIGDVALDCGFSDLSNFNRAFRRQFGATPSEVRAASLTS